MSWRRLPFLVLPGAENMALDSILARRARAGEGVFLRFYLWSRPTLSLGRSQETAAVVDFPFCAANAIDVVRRPTGGRAVLHHRELTYAVAGLFGTDGFPRGVQETYQALCEALRDGLAALGVATEPWAGAPGRLPSPRDPRPCFATPAPGEIVREGRKMIGSAMAVDGPAFLQHGSILIGVDERLQRGAQREKDDYPAASLGEALRPLPSWAGILDALTGGFERRFGTGAMGCLEWSEADQGAVRERAAAFRIPAGRPSHPH